MGLTTKGATLLAAAVFLPFLLPILIVYSAFDSVHTARRLNSGEPVADWDLSTLQNALSQLGLPASSASWIFGAMLAIAGIVLLVGNLTNLASLLNWWELLPSTYTLRGRKVRRSEVSKDAEKFSSVRDWDLACHWWHLAGNGRLGTCAASHSCPRPVKPYRYGALGDC
jgi:hypothetical protein